VAQVVESSLRQPSSIQQLVESLSDRGPVKGRSLGSGEDQTMFNPAPASHPFLELLPPKMVLKSFRDHRRHRQRSSTPFGLGLN